MVIIEFMTTQQCNLACTYCYMANVKDYMTTETVDKFFEQIGDFLKIYNDDSYHISFFGGEPLLNWKIIEYTVPKLNADPRCKSMNIISNGLELTKERVQYIKDNRLGFSMSFDGEWQKENRPLVSGKSSFERYIEKKDLIQSLTKGCKVMIQPGNFKTMTENYKFFVEEYGFMNPDFSIVRDDIYTEEDLKVFDVEIKRLADQVIEYNKQGKRTTNGLFYLYTLDIIVGKKMGKRPFGCFAGTHGAGYTPYGDWYPCARFASDKSYLLMDRDGKQYPENINKLKQPKFTDPREYKECKECSLYTYCNAGCLFSEMQYGKDEDRAKPIDSVCSILKMCYREAMRLMRELKEYETYTSSINSKLKELANGMG